MILKPYILNIIFFAFLGLVVISSFRTPPITDDIYTGMYYVHGSKIVMYYTCPFIELCGPDDGPFIDTTHIASVVTVKWMNEKTDTLHFFGLPGADEGENRIYHGRTQFGDYSNSLSRYDVFHWYRIYGSYSENSFKIDHDNAGNRYNATGKISNRTIKIQGEKTFRTITVVYDLVGEKIDLTD